MTTSAGRSAEARRTRRGPGQWLLGALLLLALGSSVFMIVTSEMSVAGSLAVITALWAAVIGAILVTKYRRAADSADAKARDLRLVYELQLEREITARRQYELGVEAQVRREVTAESGSELTALKNELQSLRESLEQMLGELPEDRIALFREKLPELENGSTWGSRPEPAYASGFAESAYPATDLVDDGAVAQQDFNSTAPPSGDSRRDRDDSTEVFPVIADAEPLPADAEPVTPEPEPEAADAVAEEEYVAEVVDDQTEADDAAPATEDVARVPGRHTGGSRRRRVEQPTEAPTGVPTEEPAEEPVEAVTEEPADVPADVPAEEPSAPQGFVDETPTDEWEAIAQPEGGIPDALLADADEQSADHPGAHASGRSVSELLEGFASSSPSSGRRRRRD